MSDTGRKDVSDKVSEKMTPDSQKSTLEKTKETVTDGLDEGAAATTPENDKSWSQKVADRAQADYDSASSRLKADHEKAASAYQAREADFSSRVQADEDKFSSQVKATGDKFSERVKADQDKWNQRLKSVENNEG